MPHSTTTKTNNRIAKTSTIVRAKSCLIEIIVRLNKTVTEKTTLLSQRRLIEVGFTTRKIVVVSAFWSRSKKGPNQIIIKCQRVQMMLTKWRKSCINHHHITIKNQESLLFQNNCIKIARTKIQKIGISRTNTMIKLSNNLYSLLTLKSRFRIKLNSFHSVSQTKKSTLKQPFHHQILKYFLRKKSKQHLSQ